MTALNETVRFGRAPHRVDQSVVRARLGRTAPRTLAMVLFVGLVFRHTLILTLDQISDGGNTAYLAAVPIWCGTIAWGRRHRVRRGIDIHDRQIDWLAAIAVTLIATWTLAMAQKRLGDVALIWRPDLLAAIAWAWACATVLFGLRPTLTNWPVWLFALICWPATYQLSDVALGRGPTGRTALDLLLAIVAVALAADSARRRAAAVGVLAITGGILALTFTNRAIVPRGPGAASHARSGVPIHDPARTLIAIAALGLIGAFVSVTIGSPPTSVDAVLAPTVAAVPHVPRGWTLVSRDPVRWAASYFGAHATLVRYTFRSSDVPARAVIDVLRGADDTDLGAEEPTFYYDHYAAIGDGQVGLSPRIAVALTQSNPAADLSPSAPAWVSVAWETREAGPGGLSQEITVFVPSAPGAPVPGLVRPSVATTLMRPLGQLILASTKSSAVLPAGPIRQALSVSRSVLGAMR